MAHQIQEQWLHALVGRGVRNVHVCWEGCEECVCVLGGG